MKFSNSYEARIELATAIAKIQTAAAELNRPDLTDEEKFGIVWSLAFVELRDLECYRCMG